jgi:molecular chaperone IbpA
MRNYDLTPLFRSTIGFDQFGRLFDTVNRASESDLAYPPYNIERLDEDRYRITMAVAGFSLGDFEVNQHGNVLVISGTAQPEPEGVTILHRGIAGRAFERRFELAENVEAMGATHADGLLIIDLVHAVPEAMKPKTIEIKANGGTASDQPKAA